MAQTTVPETRSPAGERDDARWPVAVIGVGPYGLAAAAHPRAAGVETRVFGDPMASWRKQARLRWIRPATDLLAAALLIQEREVSLGAYLGSLRGPMEFAIFAADDPLPALADLQLLLLKVWKRTVPDIVTYQAKRIAIQDTRLRSTQPASIPVAIQRLSYVAWKRWKA